MRVLPEGCEGGSPATPSLDSGFSFSEIPSGGSGGAAPALVRGTESDEVTPQQGGTGVPPVGHGLLPVVSAQLPVCRDRHTSPLFWNLPAAKPFAEQYASGAAYCDLGFCLENKYLGSELG